MANKYKAMLEYLKKCPAMQGVLNFQAAKAAGNGIQVLTEAGEAQNNRTFIDGSVEKRFDFTVAFNKPVSYAEYAINKGAGNINLEGILDVQRLIDWLEEQNTERNFPEFGERLQVESVRSMNNEPMLAWIDGVHFNPPMARYTVTVRVEYMDYTRAI